MTFNIDLNDCSGRPHWLSAKGKVNREAIYAKHRAKYLAERVRAIKPMSPEPSAQLEIIFDHAKDQGLHQHFNFERPRDAPNYSVDANYALDLEKNRLLREQVNAIENITVTVDQSSPAPTLQTHCTTNHIGQTAYTNCD